MKFNLDELHYRIKTDNKFKKRLRNIVLIGGVGIVLIAVLGVVGLVFFSSAIIGFLFANAPAFMN